MRTFFTESFTVLPFLVAMCVAVFGMPTEVYQVNYGEMGIEHAQAWRSNALRTVARVARTLLSRLAAFCGGWRGHPLALPAAVAIAAVIVQGALAIDAPAGLVLATVAASAAAPTVEQLRAQRVTVLRDAESNQTNGAFADDQARERYDERMREFDRLTEQIRAIEKAEPAPAVSPEDIRRDAIDTERRRASDIRAAVGIAKLEPSVADDLVRRGLSIDAARAEIFEKLARASDQLHPQSSHVALGEDARDKTLRGQVNWLLVRSGLAGLVAKHEGLRESDLDPGEFRGMTLLDLAKESLTRANVAFRGRSGMEVAGLAFRAGSYQTTSDFATLLENTMHKILRAAYALQPDTWSRWCGTATVSDFRAHNWYRMGSLSELESLTEHGEYKNKSIPDAEKATYQVGTKGNIIAVTRQTIVNDDLGAMARLAAMLGRAGKLTIEKRVYALLGENSGLGPTQSDSQPLFHSNRSNVGTVAALGVSALDADRVVMGQQLDPNGQDYLDLRPDVLLVPLGLGGQARVFNSMEFDDTSNKFMKPNVVRGLFREIVDTPRLSGTRRYLFADRNTAPVFLVSFLEGNQEPVLETQDGWRTDGVELRGRLDFGVDDVDYRGAVTNAGA
jgi:hypothetical protein